MYEHSHADTFFKHTLTWSPSSVVLRIRSLDCFKVDFQFEVSTIVTFFSDLFKINYSKLSRLDLTFFQLLYVGLFKQSFPSRNPNPRILGFQNILPRHNKYFIVKIIKWLTCWYLNVVKGSLIYSVFANFRRQASVCKWEMWLKHHWTHFYR